VKLLREIFSLFFYLNVVVEEVIVSLGVWQGFIFFIVELEISLSESNIRDTHCGIVEVFLSLLLNPCNHAYDGILELIKLVPIDGWIREVRYQDW
jgi:hypothetical protein